MSKLIYRILERILSGLKHRDYRLDRRIPLSSMAGTSIRRATWLLRGTLRALIFQRRLAIVFIAPGVNLRNASMIRLGRGVTLERNVIIDGLAHNGVEIGAHTFIGAHTVMRCSSLSDIGAGIQFGSNSSVDAFSFIGAGGPVHIGDNVIMGQHVSFHAENHSYDRTDIPIKYQGVTRKGITIENDCWVGSNVTFLDGAYVGRGTVIGAGSIVRGHVPAYSVAVGCPARVIKSRKQEEIVAGRN